MEGVVLGGTPPSPASDSSVAVDAEGSPFPSGSVAAFFVGLLAHAPSAAATTFGSSERFVVLVSPPVDGVTAVVSFPRLVSP